MQVSVENTSTIGRRLTVNVPAERVYSEINERMREVLRTRKLDGFRPGKVPKQLIEQKYGVQIRHEVISKIIETSLPTVLKQEALEPAGRPEVERITDLNENSTNLTYVVSFEIFPEFSLADFSLIQIEKNQAEVSESDVDKAIDKLKEQLANWILVERAAKKGDRLTIDYTSLLNGKPYENNGAQGVFVELGNKGFIEGFEEGLLNAKAGEERELDLFFPSDWRFEKLAGKPVHFSVQIKSVEEKQLAELDEQFAKKIGASDGTLSSIRKKVHENLEIQLASMIKENIKKQVLDKLLEFNEMDLPKALIEHEMSLLHEDLHRKMGDKGDHACQHHGLEEEAKRRVRLSLILRKIVNQENLTADNEKVREKIAEIAKSFGNAELMESMYYESKELLSGIQNSVLVDQVIDLILTKASIILKSVTMEEFFKET